MEPKVLTTEEAIAVIQSGGVVVYPTETSYGIGCDATNKAAVEKVAAIKGRPKKYAMALIVPDMETAKWCGTVAPAVEAFASRHWPGPLTILLPDANEALSDWSVQNGTVGVRVSSHPVALALAKGLGKPLIATSANVHKKPSSYSIEEAFKQFSQGDVQPDGYIDGGRLPEVPASMIIEWSDGEIVVHRQGSFKLPQSP